MSKKKFRKGGLIQSVEELSRQEYIYHYNQVLHEGWFKSWPLRFCENAIKNKQLSFAIKIQDGGYRVKFESNEGSGDGVSTYQTPEEAEIDIEKELCNVKEAYGEYHYGDFIDDYGHLYTEIWKFGEDQYARWTRLWEEVQ